ncbi:hypothetical protein ACFL0N_01570 [Pseudomonadota bacterium]
MSGFSIYKSKQPWRDALIATTGLSAFVLAATMLWNSGYPEWAFALSFVSVWLLIYISWSNIDFTEQSGTLLASIMDQNFDQIHDRVEQLEEELSRLKGFLKTAERNSTTTTSFG